jgi:hypothetical protein
MTTRRARLIPGLLLSALALAAGREARAAPPEPPLSVSLRLLSADASRGRYRVEVRLRAQAPLEDAVMILKVAPRDGTARTALRADTRETREAVSLPPGRELRRELDVLTGAQEPVTLLVGLGGRAGGAQVHRTRALDLGPEPPADAGARRRTDQFGRTYYEVPMQDLR